MEVVVDSEWSCMFENLCDKPGRGDTMHLVDRSHFFYGSTSVNLQTVRSDMPISSTVHKPRWTMLEGVNTLSHWCDPTILRCYVLLRPVDAQSDFSARARIPPMQLLGWRLLVHPARFKHALEHDATTMRGLRHFTSVMITLHHKHHKGYVEVDAYVNTTIFNDPPRLPVLNIPLRPAQEQSLKWMQIMEDGILATQNFISTPRWFPLGGNTDYVCLLNEEVLVSTETLQQFSALALVDTVTYHGGILADRPGAGKTAIVLALIATTTTTREDARPRSAMERVTSLPINASLVIVPMNLVAQWQAEVVKFMPASFKCVTIVNKRQYASATVGDVQDADMVLTTIEFLTGRAYPREAKSGDFYTLSGHRRKARDEVNIIFRGFWWRRVVFDEQHVLPHVTSNGWKHIKAIRASVYWGVTATPCTARINDVLRVRPDDLGKLDSGVLFTNTIRRTPVPSHLPPVDTQHHYVSITSRERDILDMHRHEGLPQLIQLCTCFNVLALLGNSEDVNARVCMTFDELSRIMVTRRAAEVAAVEPEVEIISRLIAADTRVLAQWGAAEEPGGEQKQEDEEEEKEEQEQEQEDGFVRMVRRRLKVSKRRHAALQAHVSRLRGQSVFFQRQVELSEEERVCPICMVSISNVMTTCGHWFCKACTHSYKAGSRTPAATPCPLCKVSLGPRDWVEVMGTGAEATPTNMDAPAHEYGSKLRAIVELVRRLQGIGEKAIMFVQWSELSRTLRAILLAGGVKVVSMTGNTCSRNAAVERMKKGNADLLLLSMDVSTTGLDLTMANHVIFAHALVGGSPSTQERRVSQAVSRVHRFGQTRNVSVHWFIAEDTCEHDLFRSNLL